MKQALFKLKNLPKIRPVLFAGLILLASAGASVVVVAAGSQYYRSYTDNAWREITAYNGTTYVIRSTTDYFIPNNSQAEWDAFFNKAKTGGLSGLEIVRRVYANTVTPYGHYLSTYDDYRWGPYQVCELAGLSAGTTGNYRCVAQTVVSCNGNCCDKTGCSCCSVTYGPPVDYRHNGGWGTSDYGLCWGTSPAYVEWVDCYIQ